MVEINVPGSKSITQRALICASLGNGESVIKNPLFSEDTLLLANGLKKLGILVKAEKECFKVLGNHGKFYNNGEQTIYMENNGTGFRFLTAISGFYPNTVILTGNNRMKKRPVKELVESLKSIGFNISYIETIGFPPLKIEGYKSLANFIEIDASKSSQFLSSLLLSSVLFGKKLNIKIKNKLVSKSYVDITIDVMKDFGVDVVKNNLHSFIINSNTKFSSKEYIVESDFSSASYFLAAPIFTGKPLKIRNLNYNKSLQGDKYFIDILIRMGANIKISNNKITVYPSTLNGIEVDMNYMPDMVPTLACVAAVSKGETIIKNIEHLRYKETDRIETVVKNLIKIGVKAEAGKSFIKIKGGLNLQNAEIDPENDHRIAMSFALFSLINNNIKILNKSCVNKSFPKFWEEFKKL